MSIERILDPNYKKNTLKLMFIRVNTQKPNKDLSLKKMN